MRATASISLFLLVPFSLFFGYANGQTAAKPGGQPVLPTIFLLGEFEKQYEEKMPTYQSLLGACGNDMNLAFDKLMSMMQEMEAYAGLTGYDLKGINAWMHFFWREDGTIEHIGFYLKPNSRNVNTDGLKSFLSAFAKQYKFPLRNSQQYSHYSSFSFPLMLQSSSSPTPSNERTTAKKGGNGSNR